MSRRLDVISFSVFSLLLEIFSKNIRKCPEICRWYFSGWCVVFCVLAIVGDISQCLEIIGKTLFTLYSGFVYSLLLMIFSNNIRTFLESCRWNISDSYVFFCVLAIISDSSIQTIPETILKSEGHTFHTDMYISASSLLLVIFFQQISQSILESVAHPFQTSLVSCFPARCISRFRYTWLIPGEHKPKEGPGD